MSLSIPAPQKVLIINIFGIGDVLFTTPMLSNLKTAFPKAQIGYLCNRRTASLLEKSPKIDKVFVYERDEYVEVLNRSKLSYFNKLKKFRDHIKAEGYDWVIDLSMTTLFSFFTYWAGIKYRVGFNYKNRSRFLTHPILLKGYENKHVVEYYLDLLRQLGMTPDKCNLEIFLDSSDEQWAESFITNNKINSKQIIGIVPGGGDSWGKDSKYKRWGAENYAKIADKLIEKFSADIILLGGENEKSLCDEVASKMQQRSFTACGQTSISQFAAVTKKCLFTLLNDGGPLHIAVAAGARTVSVFGPVDDQVYGPYPKDNHVVISKDLACRPCYRRFRRAQCDHISCLRDISVEDVLKQIEKIFT